MFHQLTIPVQKPKTRMRARDVIGFGEVGPSGRHRYLRWDPMPMRLLSSSEVNFSIGQSSMCTVRPLASCVEEWRIISRKTKPNMETKIPILT